MKNSNTKTVPQEYGNAGTTAKIGRTVFSLKFRFAEKGRGSVEDKILSVVKREKVFDDSEEKLPKNA